MPLDLEVFKKMSKEEITEYGESLSYGFARDENGNLSTFKDSDGFWSEYTYDERGNKLSLKDSNGFWCEYTRDENGKVLSYKDSDGYWYEYTYDKNGKELTYKNSKDFWNEYTRDENGNRLTYKDSDGDDIKYFFWGEEYNLGYDTNSKKYHAGCQTLTYEECEKFYENNKDKFEDSHNFIEAIREHQKTLTESIQ